MGALFFDSCLHSVCRSRNEKEKVELTPKEQRDKQRELEEKSKYAHIIKCYNLLTEME